MNRIIYVDIDNCITKTNGADYTNSTPRKERIHKINRMYEEGFTIIYWTARGSTTGINWRKLTKQQLKDWGAKYTKLKMKKPQYELFICDKCMHSDYFFGDKK
jgi:hypothetical protein